MNSQDDLDFKPSVLLRDGIDLQKMASDTIVPFETDTEFLHQLELNGLDNEDSDSEEPKFFGYQDMKHWCEQSFESLRSQMSPADVNGLIRKSTIVPSEGPLITDDYVIKVRLSGFCEGADAPFTYTEDNKTMIINIAEGGQLPGLNMALMTMKIGEYSRFLLSYKVMYGELGCPPLIPAKADCLFNILVVGLVPAIEDRSELNDDENSSFQNIYEKAVALHISGKIFFEKHDYKFAIRSFRSALHYLEFCRLKDEVEERKQQKFLAKLYLNLAICYNKTKLPLKACSMCNQLNYMGQLWNNSKALLHNGRALTMIGDYQAAEKRIKAALRQDKDCPDIKNELALIQEKKTLHAKHEALISQKLQHSFKVYRERVTEPNKPSEEFSSSLEEFCISILNNKDVITANLPGGLTKAESSEVKRVAQIHNLFCEDNDIVTYISKIQLSDDE